jgi:hypothetical protein
MDEENDTSESEASELSPEAGVVCPACLEINPPRADYCAKCAAPLNSLVAFNPFDQTLVEGFGYRRAVDGPPSKIILIGIWILFAPSFLIIPLLFSDLQRGIGSLGIFGFICQHAFLAAYAPLSIVMLYRTTANFISKRKRRESGKA